MQVSQMNLSTLRYEPVEGLENMTALRLTDATGNQWHITDDPDGSGIQVTLVYSTAGISQMLVAPMSSNRVGLLRPTVA